MYIRMIGNRNSVPIRRKAWVLADEAACHSVAEVSEELASVGIDPEKVAAEMGAIAQEAKRLAGKSRLARAKDAVNTFRSRRTFFPRIARKSCICRIGRDQAYSLQGL